jgi:signal transduction histidine kinase
MRSWLRNHPTAADVLLATVLGALCIPFVFGDGDADLRYEGPDGLYAALLVALVAPLAVRRRYPLVVAGFAAVPSAAIWLCNYFDGPTAFVGGIAVYTGARYGRKGLVLRTFGPIVAGLFVVGAVAAAMYPDSGGWEQLVSRMAVTIGSLWFGDARRSRAELLDSLRERAHRAEADRQREAEHAVAEERGRIARDLHDVVAHSLSVMVVQASAAERLVQRDPDRAIRSIAQVADTGRSAMSEMRRILDVLDDGAGSGGRAPQPRLSDLAALVSQSQAPGLTIEFAHAGDLDTVDAGVQLAVYRVVQEALTNAIKHAGPARVTVQLGVGDDLSLAIADDGIGPIAVKTDGGRGLIGMRERIESLGGVFACGPRVGGGFSISARVPVSTRTARVRSVDRDGDAHVQLEEASTGSPGMPAPMANTAEPS